MEDINKDIPGKHNKNKEFYKKIWLSLFEWRTLSTCQDNDLDLFGASALLKSAFYQFAKLKKRLNESQNLVETLTSELDKVKLENENFSKKLNCLQATCCTHCQSLKDIQSYAEGLVWDSEKYPQGSKEPEKDFAIPRPLVNQKTESSVKKIRIPDSEAQYVRELDFGSCERGSGDQVIHDPISVVHPPLNLLETQKLSPPAAEGRNVMTLPENCLVSRNTAVKTPEKKHSPDRSIEKSSPVLNSQKRAKRFSFSPRMNVSGSNLTSKSPKSPSCLMLEGGSAEMGEECNDKALNQIHPGEGGILTVKHKGKLKLSMLRLKLKLPNGTQSTQSLPTRSKVSCSGETSRQDLSGLEKSPKSPLSARVKRGRIGGTLEDAGQPACKVPLRCHKANVADAMPPPTDKPSPVLLFVPQSKTTNVEEDDDLIIMPSPNSSKSGDAFINGDCDEGDLINSSHEETPRRARVGVNHLMTLRGKCHDEQGPPPHMSTDTEVTYFVPVGEEGCSEGEEGGGGSEANVSRGNLEDNQSHCATTSAATAKAVLQPSHCFLSSFDRVPPKSPGPKFKHQRATVRKKSERMQMEGWECKACKKYYDAVGTEVKPHERKGRVNKCSRHRDPLFPSQVYPQRFLGIPCFLKHLKVDISFWELAVFGAVHLRQYF